LAYSLGFKLLEIHRLQLINTDNKIAHDALLTARDCKRYRYPNSIKDLTKQIRKIFKTTIKIENTTSNPLLVVDGLGEDIPQRYRQLFKKTYNNNQQFLFLEHINKINEDTGNRVISFFVKKSVYNTFFRISTVSLLYNYSAPTLGIN